MPVAHSNQPAKGFTLVELVIVIVLLGIVATFTFRFVGIGAEMFAQGSERLQTLEQGRFAVERLSRELKQAVPNSVRTITPGASALQCVEFTPTRAAGRYRRGPGGNTFTLISFSQGWQTLGSDRAFIYATQTPQIYSATAERYVTLDAGQSPDADFVTELTYSGNIQGNSPQRRVYIGQTPVSYCLQGNQLWRYANYGWLATQPTPGNGLSGGVLMAERLNNSNSGALPFAVNAANLQRTSTVTLYLEFVSNSTEPLFFNYEVNIANAP